MSNPNCDNVSKQPTKPRKKNALAHGIYGKDIFLPWESRKDFEKLLADLRDDFRPVGRMQNDIVFDLAHLRWQKYRVHKMYIGAAYRVRVRLGRSSPKVMGRNAQPLEKEVNK